MARKLKSILSNGIGVKTKVKRRLRGSRIVIDLNTRVDNVDFNASIDAEPIECADQGFHYQGPDGEDILNVEFSATTHF